MLGKIVYRFQMIAGVRVICFGLLLLAFSFRASAEDFTNAVRAFLQHRIEVEKRDVAIVVGLVDEHGSRVVSCGKMDNGTDRDVNGDTLFELGSITKTFTALLLQDMIERGEMKLDDPVAKYLPKSVKMPTHHGKEITLLHLATHTSGLPFFPGNLDPKRADNPFADYTAEKLVSFLSGCQLTRNPGAKYQYSEVGMQLLGYVIALRAGTNYEALLVDRICRPLKMDSTRTALTPELKARFATGHNEFGYAAPSMDFQTLVGGSGLHSTANDLLKYLSANLGLTPSSLTPLMEKTQVAHLYLTPTYQFGLAWLISHDLQGARIVRHGGGTPGYSAFVAFDKSRRRGVVVLSSLEDIIDIGAIGKLLLKSEWQPDRRPKETKLGSEVYGSYVGGYRLSPDFALGMLTARLFLLHVPKVLIWVPAGVCLAAVIVLFWRVARLRRRWMKCVHFWRAASFRKRWIILSCGALGGGLLAAVIALVSSYVVCAIFHPGLNIRREGDRLFVQTTLSPITMKLFPQIPAVVVLFINSELMPHLTAEFLPASETRFFERMSGIPMTFSRDPRGKVTRLTAHMPGAECSFERISNEAPEPPRPRVAIKLDPKLYNAYVGSYEFAPDTFFPAGIKLTIRQQGDRLVGQASSKNNGWGAFDIYPESETNFFVTIFGADLTFIKNDKGLVTAAIRHVVGLPDCEAKKVKNLSE